MFFKTKPKYTSKKMIAIIIFVNLFFYLISFGMPYMKIVLSNIQVATFFFLLNLFTPFGFFYFGKKADEVDEVLLTNFINEKDNAVKELQKIEFDKVKLENQSLKTELAEVKNSFEPKITERLKKEREDFERDERLRKQSYI